jgi:hypothetical protein
MLQTRAGGPWELMAMAQSRRPPELALRSWAIET